MTQVSTTTSKVFGAPLVTALSLILTGISSTAQAVQYQAKLVRCDDTAWPGTCGGDDLGSGSIRVEDDGRVRIKVSGALADPFNLYEVYWLPIGSSVADAVYLGNFATKCNGDRKAWLSDIETPYQAKRLTPVNMFTRVGAPSAGNFLIYSRGPWARDSNDDCRVDQFNTTPLGMDPNQPLANPAVDLASDGVQFISGYALPSP